MVQFMNYPRRVEVGQRALLTVFGKGLMDMIPHVGLP